MLGSEVEVPAGSVVQQDARREYARARTLSLFAEVREPLARYLVSLGAAPADVEELTQEVFLRLHRHLGSEGGRQEGQNLQGWVFRVAQNLVRDRQRGWQGRHIESIEDRPEAGLAMAPGASPEERVLRLEQVKRLRTAMGRLTETQRRCLQLRSEGLRYREIAVALEVSVTTVADMVRESLALLGRARDDD